MDFNEKSRIYQESERNGRSCPRVSSLEKFLLCIIVVLVTIGFGLSVAIANINEARKKEMDSLKETMRNVSNICFSLDCVTEASNLMNSMDLAVDPCTDFYSFACGNWIRNAHLAASLESQFTELTDNVLFRIKELLEDSEKENATSKHQKKTTKFYQACVDEVHRKVLGAEELLSDLKKLGGWPLIENYWDPNTFNWADLMLNLFRTGYISNMFFTINVGRDAKNTSRSVIEVEVPSLGLNNKLYYSHVYKSKQDLYKDALFKLAKKFKDDIDEGNSKADIEDAFEIEMRLAELSKNINRKDPDDFYNVYRLKELNKLAPMIPWSGIFNGLLPQDTELLNDDRILVTVPSMIKGLNTMLEEYLLKNQRALANYMYYRVVFSAATHLSSEFYDVVIEATGKKPTKSEWETCVEATMESFPHSLTSSYVKKYMKEESKNLLDMMVQDLRKSLAEQILKADWLDIKTKEYALLKVREMKKAVAYRKEILNDTLLDEFYGDINISNNHFRNVKEVTAFKNRRGMQGLHAIQRRLRWDEINNLLAANAYYYPGQNAIIVPVGFLQNTVFASNRPKYLNYGSLGMVVAHELTHAFDSIGSHFDAEGNHRMWWTMKSWQRFLERTKCYEDQYNSYYMKAAETYVNGTITLAENIADNGGIRTAYQAYTRLLERIGSEKSLPGLPYNEKQMFWISFASVWCRKQSESSLLYTVKHSVHTHSMYRVIGSLSNMKEFSNDFHCKLNSTMNPEKRCSLWT